MNKKEAYFILISTFVLILAWIVFSILQSAVSSTISAPLTVQINPIRPTFDIQIITALKKRTVVTPLTDTQIQTASTAAQPTVSPSIEPSPTQPVSTTSAILIPNQL